jgi:hypothetical protein
MIIFFPAIPGIGNFLFRRDIVHPVSGSLSFRPKASPDPFHLLQVVKVHHKDPVKPCISSFLNWRHCWLQISIPFSSATFCDSLCGCISNLIAACAGAVTTQPNPAFLLYVVIFLLPMDSCRYYPGIPSKFS